MNVSSAARARDVWVQAGVVIGLCFSVAACATAKQDTAGPEVEVAGTPAIAASTNSAAAPKPGKPYQIAGKWYEPKDDPTYDREGVASWYGRQFHGRRTANGEVFDRSALTAAHPTLPLPSYVRVTNLANDRAVTVRVNDRGPFSRTRLIDVSERTADLLGFRRNGMAPVRVQYVAKATVDGNDEEFLLASYRGPDSGGATPSVILASSSGDARPLRPKGRSRQVQIAAAASAAPQLASVAEPDNPFAFAASEEARSSPVPAEVVDALTTSYPADTRISMTFDLISDPRD